MGSWGPGIFSDDVACDVRDEFRFQIGEGVPVEQASDRALDLYRANSDRADTEDGWVAVIALAVTQWKTGRLLDRVRDRALEVIDSGIDLERWADSGQFVRRKQALARARSQLLSPQPPQTRIAKSKRNSTPFSPGDLIVYHHDSGRSVVMWCVKNLQMGHSIDSQFELLDLDPGVAIRDPDSAQQSHGRHDPRQARNVGFLVVGCQDLTTKKYELIGAVERSPDRPGVAMVTTFIKPTQQFAQSSLDRMLDRYL